uniref:Uncharacterized protein n=1 Tax=Anopheles maculatus TaxID=74869 RepID=A0A182T3U7_9DIPT
MIWTRDSPLIEMFGLELYVGRSNHSHREPLWDRELLINTTAIVDDHLFYRPKNNYCFSQCLVSDQQQTHEEVAHLKEILEQKIRQCIGTQASEYLFFPLENAVKLVADPELYVKSRLWNVEVLRPLVNNVVTSYLAHNGVGFRMYTVIDKFKVLELGKGYLDVIDFDSFLQETD